MDLPKRITINNIIKTVLNDGAIRLPLLGRGKRVLRDSSSETLVAGITACCPIHLTYVLQSQCFDLLYWI
jgi:hypothetical protein